MEREYQQIKEDFIQVSSETRNKLTALCVVVIGAIYFFSSADNEKLLKFALVFYFITILLEIVSGYLKSQHYALWFDKKIRTIDFRESLWGRVAEYTFWIPVLTFLIGSILFFIGIFKDNSMTYEKARGQEIKENIQILKKG